MGFLQGIFSAPKSNAAGAPKYTQLQVQTSAYGLVVPIVYGRTRVACELVDYQNFQQHTTSTGGGGGGKGGAIGGGGGKGPGSSQTTYSVDFLAAICEGPITGIGASWKSQTKTTPAADGLSIIDGNIGQSLWSYWADTYPARASIGYSGIAYVGAASYDLGNSNQLPNFNFEVEGILQGTAPGSYAGGGDADPSQVLPDILTNAQYGAGFPTGRVGELANNSEDVTVPASGPYEVTVAHAAEFAFPLDVVKPDGTILTCVSGTPGANQYSRSGGVYTFSSVDAGASVTINYASAGALTGFQDWCLASGLWISPALTAQQDAASFVSDIGVATHADPVWSCGFLGMVPRGTRSISGNGHTWDPVAAPEVELTDDDFLPQTNPIGTGTSSGNTDPVILTRLRASDQINDLKFEVLDRANEYAPAVVEVSDQALMDRYGRRTSPSRQMHMFADLNAANVSAQLQLQDQYIRNYYSFQTDQRFGFLDPGDIVSLTTSKGALALNAVWVRIVECQENFDGSLSWRAEEYPGGTGAAAQYALNAGSGYSADYNVDPGDVNTPIIFEPPLLATNGNFEIWAAISGGVNWGGCEIWASTDGTNYSLVGTVQAPCRTGDLVAPLASIAVATSGDTLDTSDVLQVDLSESRGVLDSVSEDDARAYNTLCYVDGELIAFRDAALISTSHYHLSWLLRGLLGSTIGAHAIGSQFARLDNQTAKIPYTRDRIGQTIYLKFRSFNQFGGGLQDLAALAAHSYVIQGGALTPPPNVTGFSARQIGAVVAFKWNSIGRYTVKGYDIGYAPKGTTDWASFTLLTEAEAGTEMTNAEVLPGDWTFAIRAHDLADQLSPALATADLAVVNTNPTIYDVDEASDKAPDDGTPASPTPAWGGTISNFVKHYTNKLVPKGTHPCSFYVAWEDFDELVPDPVSSASYTTGIIDTGYDDSLRVFGEVNSTLGVGQSGSPTLDFTMDTWKTGETDPNTFVSPPSGTTLMRYLRGRITYSSIAAGAISLISGFIPFIDKTPSIEQSDTEVTVAAGGTHIDFPTPFHQPPVLTVTPTSTGATSASVANVTATGFDLHVWQGSTDTGGTATWSAKGE